MTLEGEPIVLSPLKSLKLEAEVKSQTQTTNKLLLKVDKLNGVAEKMRRDFHKELLHYKEQERMRKYRLVHLGQSATEEEEEKISIQVEYFDVLTGIDDTVLKLINEKIEGIKTIYQERIRSSLRYE